MESLRKSNQIKQLGGVQGHPRLAGVRYHELRQCRGFQPDKTEVESSRSMQSLHQGIQHGQSQQYSNGELAYKGELRGRSRLKKKISNL